MITTDWHGNLRGASQPCSIVRLDGHDVWFLNWQVNLNSTHEADDFTITLPFKIARDMPSQSYQVNTPDYTTYLFTNANILVEIFVGYPDDAGNFTTDDLTRIMYGYMDEANISLDENQGETVTLRGRNMIAPFLDNKTTNKYQNMTFSAIAQMFATSHGLQTSITPTYTLAGTYYSGDSVNMATDSTEWDELTLGASYEGYELRVRDNTLYFGPFDTVVGNLTTDPLNYTWGQNVVSATIDKQPHASKDISIEVHSYDKKTKKHIKAVANKKGTNTASGASSYVERFYYPGITQDQAQKKATSLLNTFSRLEVTGTLSVIGNEELTVDRQIALYGVGIGLSDFYYVRKVTHSFDQNSGGYMCNVTFSNLLLQDQATTGGL